MDYLQSLIGKYYRNDSVKMSEVLSKVQTSKKLNTALACSAISVLRPAVKLYDCASTITRGVKPEKLLSANNWDFAPGDKILESIWDIL